MIVKINSQIDFRDSTELTPTDALSLAKTSVATIDELNYAKDALTLTKLYYFFPNQNRLIILISTNDSLYLGTDEILLDTQMSSFPIERLPSDILTYNEVIVTNGSTSSTQDAIDVAQYIANELSYEVFPIKIPIIKVINYNSNESFLVLHNSFMNSIFSSTDTIIRADGDITAGEIKAEGL